MDSSLPISMILFILGLSFHGFIFGFLSQKTLYQLDVVNKWNQSRVRPNRIGGYQTKKVHDK